MDESGERSLAADQVLDIKLARNKVQNEVEVEVRRESMFKARWEVWNVVLVGVKLRAEGNLR